LGLLLASAVSQIPGPDWPGSCLANLKEASVRECHP
jgi:hypothetical protein